MFVQWVAKRLCPSRILYVLRCVWCAKHNSFGKDEHAAFDDVIGLMMLYLEGYAHCRRPLSFSARGDRSWWFGFYLEWLLGVFVG